MTLTDTQQLFKIATGLYILSLVSAIWFSRRPRTLLFFLVFALLANATALIGRYWIAWPMLPMYAGVQALPVFMGTVAFAIGYPCKNGSCPLRIILTWIVVIALAGVLFPKNYYIPFIKSQTVWAHLFFRFGVAGRGCFLFSAAWAMAGLIEKSENEGRKTRDEGRNRRPTNRPSSLVHRPSNASSPSSRTMHWAIWGFAFLTLSMFAGELWSYLGWGTPVVWDDPAITTTMATWFFYICLLHLHLTGTWSTRARSLYAAAGALVVLGLNCVPELGPLRWPL